MKATLHEEIPNIVNVPQLVEQPPSVSFMKACASATRHVPSKFRLPPRLSTANQDKSDTFIREMFQKATVVTNGRAGLPSRIDLPSLDIDRHPSPKKVNMHYKTQKDSPLSSWISVSPGNTGPNWRRHVLNYTEPAGTLRRHVLNDTEPAGTVRRHALYDIEPAGNLTQDTGTKSETVPQFQRNSSVHQRSSVVIDSRMLGHDHRNLQGRAWPRHRYYPSGVYRAAFPVVRDSSQPGALPETGYHQAPDVVPPIPTYQREAKRAFGESMVSGTPLVSYASREAVMQYGTQKRLHHHYHGNRLTHDEAIPQVRVRSLAGHHRTDLLMSRRSDFVTGNVIPQRQITSLAPPLYSVTNRETGVRSVAPGRELVSITRTPDTTEKSVEPFISASSLPSVPTQCPKRPPPYTLPGPLIKKAKGFDKLDLLCSATLDIGELHDNPTGCSCPKSKCVALYCDCFKAGRRCDPTNCSCVDCKNTIAESGVDGARTKAIRNIISRNPRAFNTAGVGNPTLKLPPGEIACNCVRSRCLKLYCSCFHNGKTCKPAICTCVGCQNTEEDEEGHRQAAIEQAIEKRVDAFVVKQKAKGMGCACKNNRCIRKYCECFRTGLGCTDKCTCRECENQKV